MDCSGAKAKTVRGVGEWHVFDACGQRKYVTAEERVRFLSAAKALSDEKFALCALLAFAGCRISEALELPRSRLHNGAVTLRTLKRRKTSFRSVPVPEWLLAFLIGLPHHDDAPDRIWLADRSTAYRWVKRAMEKAGIEGLPAMPKGLRHGFGLRAASCDVPPNLIQRWLGHASPLTTAIYLSAVGTEERRFAERMWG